MSAQSTEQETLLLTLAGNPNSGKTSIFNALTGLRHKTSNYPGVTVERVEGTVDLGERGKARLVDLPGSYSIFARSEDERIARNVLLGLQDGESRPDVVIAVLDASNLERNLYLATQLIETGLPVCIALNMVDIAKRRRMPVDAAVLEEALGVPVVPVVGRSGENVDALKAAVLRAKPRGRLWRMPGVGEEALADLRTAVEASGLVPAGAADGEALRLLCHARDDDPFLMRGGEPLRTALDLGRARLEEASIDHAAVDAECRYALCADVVARSRAKGAGSPPGRSERIDRILTHRIVGPILFLAVMALVFQTIYSWADPFMGWIETLMGLVGDTTRSVLGDGMLTDLLVDGVIEGVGAIIIFLPQICLLFLFLTLLEDVGYLARAAFIVDRAMRGVGLNGRAFIPLMSSFACAIPGIMATRTIDDRRDRLVTILIAPLMSCSARLPVYVLMIGTFIPSGYRGLTLFSMYALSVVAGLGVAWVLRRTIFKGKPSTFLMELPSYKAPGLRHVLRTVGNRGWVFVQQAGTVILALTVVLWFLAYFPRSDELAAEAEQRIEAGADKAEVEGWYAAEHIRQSWMGRVGRFIEPVIEPLGFDWRTGIGVLASFAAREVLVSTLGVVYAVGDADEESVPLRERLKRSKRPDGSPTFTPLVAISLMVFFVLACQCMSTLAVAKRETNSWRWPFFMFGYMTALAYVASLVVYQGGLALGWG
ncbi:MAG: ferrous iron transport protein B [Planctomycetota bacterium]